jgi:hypothetical protein
MKLLALFLFLFPLNCEALNLSEIRADVRSLVTDGQGTRQRFSNAELNLWINEGQKIADIRTLCTYKSYNFTLVAGTTYYALPNGFIAIRRVTRDNLSIQEMSPAALDGRSAEWETASGLPTYYFTNFSTRGVIGFAPFPAVVGDTAPIHVEYMAYSGDLVADADIPFGGIVEFYPYHYALTFYAAYKASVIDERDNKAKVFMESFASIVTMMKDQCIIRPNYLPSASARQ